MPLSLNLCPFPFSSLSGECVPTLFQVGFPHQSFCSWDWLGILIPTVLGRIMPPERLPHPNPRNLWICYVTWWKRLCRCDQVEDLEIDRLSRITGWVPCNHKGPCKWKREAGGSESEKKIWWSKQRSEWWRDTSQGMWGAPRSWERQGSTFFLRSSRRNAILLTPDCSPVKLILDFWPPEL